MVFENSGQFAVVALWLKVDHFVLLLRLRQETTLIISWLKDNIFHSSDPGCSKGGQRYPPDKSMSTKMDCFVNNYPLDSDVSGG